MIIQRIGRLNPEKVFVVVRNDTASAFTKGAPVNFKFDGTRDGLDVEDINTGAAAKNHLVAGCIVSALAASAFGLAQCYGVRTDVPMLKCGTATAKNAAIGDAMILDTANDGLSGVAAGAVTAWLAAFVMGETLASSSATVTTTGTVFLRLM